MPVCLSVCMSVCLSGRLSVCPSVCLSVLFLLLLVCLACVVYQSNCKHIYNNVCRCIKMCQCLLICLIVCLSVCLSVGRSVCLSVCPPKITKKITKLYKTSQSVTKPLGRPSRKLWQYAGASLTESSFFLVVKQLYKQVYIFNIIFAHNIDSIKYPIAIFKKKLIH